MGSDLYVDCASLATRVAKEPLTSYICDCHRCQTRAGSAFSMSIVLPATGLSHQPAKTERPLANGSKNCSYVCRHCYSRLYALRDARRRSADGNAGQNQLHPPSGSNLDKQRPSLGDVEDDGILSYSEQPANFGPLIEAWKAAR